MDDLLVKLKSIAAKQVKVNLERAKIAELLRQISMKLPPCIEGSLPALHSASSLTSSPSQISKTIYNDWKKTSKNKHYTKAKNSVQKRFNTLSLESSRLGSNIIKLEKLIRLKKEVQQARKKEKT